MPPVSQVSMMEEQQRQSNMVRSAGASSAPHGSTEYFFMPFICLLRVRNDARLDFVGSECKENPPARWLTLPCQHVFALFFYKHAANMHDEHERGNTERVQTVIYIHLTAGVPVSPSEAALLSI